MLGPCDGVARQVDRMLFNATPFAAIDIPTIDPTGRPILLVVVKATFDVKKDGRLAAAEEPPPLRASDVMVDPDRPNSSAKYPADIGQEKLGTDVAVIGDAISPQPVTVLDVAVKVKDVLAPLRVHGERVFFRDVSGIGIGPAAAFTRKPIIYEKAYGGEAADSSVVERRNPSGVGVAKSASDLVDTPAPQIEHPARPHTSARDKHAPMGYGPILGHWAPRCTYAGTFDAAWEATRMPLMPRDFDKRYNNVAHPSLLFETPLACGDPVSIIGMSEEPLGFNLPRLPIAIRARFSVTGRVTKQPPIDAVIVDTARRRVELLVRATFPLGRAVDVLREAAVHLDEPL